MNKGVKISIVLIIAVAGVIFFGILTYLNMRNMGSDMEADVAASLESRILYDAQELDNRLQTVGTRTESLGRMISSMDQYDHTAAFDYMRNFIVADTMIFGSGIWFTPGTCPSGDYWYGPYLYQTSQGQLGLTMEYSNSEYDYTRFPWYQASIKGYERVFWDEPAYDPVTNTTMMTSSYPIKYHGITSGVVTVDIGIAELEEYIKNIKIGDNGYAFLVTQSGLMIARKQPELNMSERIQDSNSQDMAAIGRDIMNMNMGSGVMLTSSWAFGEEDYVLATPIGSSGLKLVAVAPKADYSGAINRTVKISIAISVIVIVLLCWTVVLFINRRDADS